MTTEATTLRELEPFFIAPCPSSGASGTTTSQTYVLPTPLLDPNTLETARAAYESAIDELRSRQKSSLRPAVRHMLANRILSFAMFGERDPRSLADRALAHFP